MKVAAPAKINLALHVTGERADGYHLIESLVAFAHVGDVIELTAADKDSLTFSGPFGAALGADPATNLVLKARDALRIAAGSKACPPVAISLEKNLPLASGIGGGSADAAAALKGLNEFWKLGLSQAELMHIGLPLGADVPMCVYGKPLIAKGIGDAIEPIDLPELHLLLVNPGVAVSTASVFKALANKDNGALPVISRLAGEKSAQPTEGGNLAQKLSPSPGAARHLFPVEGTGRSKTPALIDYLRATRNDLEAPARAIRPVIGDAIDALERSGALFARMSGSGATCFGIYADETAAQAARTQLHRRWPDWWIG